MNFKKYFPHFTAIAAFIIITVIYFKPLYSDKVISQYDIMQHKGMSKEIIDYRNSEHKEPLWTNSMFGGMPAYQISTIYSGNWLNSIDNVFHLFMPHPSGYVFMYFFGFFILLLCLQINPWLAFVGSLAFGFSSYFFIILEVGHNSKSNAIGYLAPLLGGIILLLRGKYWLGFSIATLFMALELNTNHVQISYYGFMLFTLVFLTYFITALKTKKLNPFFIAVALFIVSFFISILPNAGNLLATYEYGNYTTRGKSELTIDSSLKPNFSNSTSGLDKDYAVQYSYGVGETFTFLIPDFKGGSSSTRINDDALNNVDPQMREYVQQFSSYFGGPEFTAGPAYIGAIVMLLAFLGLLIIDHPLKWALFTATLLSIMLAWGKNFMSLSSFFLDYLPGYNKFRAVSMINIIAELTIPLLAVLALDRIIKLTSYPQLIKIPLVKKELDLKKTIIVAIAVVGGFCLIGIVAPSLVNTFTYENEETQIGYQYKRSGATDAQINQLMPELMPNIIKARESVFKSDAIRSLIFIGLASVFLFLFITKKIELQLFIASMGIFIVADLWPVANRFLNSKSFVSKAQFNAPQPKTEADEQILLDKSLDYRVLNIDASPYQDARTSYYHKSIGGYHGAKLKKFHEIMEFHLFNEQQTFLNGFSQAYNNDSLVNALTSKLHVLNMLNAKYFILSGKQGPIAWQNPQANGNAWYVKSVKTVANADSEIVSLYDLDTKTQAVIQQKNKQLATVGSNYNANGKITLQSYKPNELVYNTDTKDKEFAVFSEIYYPKGWNAYIDGVLTPHTTVNYILRGMEIPAGKHVIEFKFEPSIYKTGNTIAIAGSVLVLITVIGGLLVSIRKKEVYF